MGMDKEKLLKIYVESKIINYNYHKQMYSKYKSDIEHAYTKIDYGPRWSTGSIISMPEQNYHSQEANNIHIARYIDELEVKMNNEKSKVDEIDNWIKECCNTNNQRMIIRKYMIENMCSDLEKTAEELNCSPDYVIKVKKKVINRIVFKKFS